MRCPRQLLSPFCAIADERGLCMRLIGDALRLSASDLMRFKGCRHATALDLRLIEVGDLKPGEDGAEAELLQKQGDEHELAFLEQLKADGRSVVEIPKDGIPLEE